MSSLDNVNGEPVLTMQRVRQYSCFGQNLRHENILYVNDKYINIKMVLVHDDPLTDPEIKDRLGTCSEFEAIDTGTPVEGTTAASNDAIIDVKIDLMNEMHPEEGIRDELRHEGQTDTQEVKISVSDPIKRISDHTYLPGLTSSHYEYLVTSVFSDSALSSDYVQSEVRRRFNDFMALADILAENMRGYFIFPKPSKGALDAAASGRTENEFIEFRRADLERYLTKLCEHPVIRQSEELKAFLTAEGSLSSSFAWQQLQPLHPSLFEGFTRLPKQLWGVESTVPNVHDVAKNARSTNDVLRMLREMGEKMKQDISSSSLELPEEEMNMRKTRSELEAYCDNLVQVSRKSEKLIGEFERLGGVIGDVGLSLIRLAKYEDEYGGPTGQYSAFSSETQKMASNSRRVGMSVVKISRQERNCTENLVLALAPIHNQLAMVQAGIEAFKEREWAFLTLMNTRETLKSTQDFLQGLEKAQNASTLRDSGTTKKIESLRNDIAGLEAVLHAAEVGYEEIKRRNMADYTRWKKEQTRDAKQLEHKVSDSMRCFDTAATTEWDTACRDIEQEFHRGHLNS